MVRIFLKNTPPIIAHSRIHCYIFGEVMTMTREDIEDIVYEMYGDEYPILIADGFDEAFLGIVHRMNEMPYLAYDYWKCVNILYEVMGGNTDEEITIDDAIEHMEHNVVCAYVGPHTPAFVRH